MKKTNWYPWMTIFATLATITVNGLANALPLNGQSTGEISDRFSIYFVPAGYVFSIWGLIYLALIAFTIYQALPAQRENQLLAKIAPAYWLASLANSVWIFLWHYERFPLTLVVMLVLLGSLLYIYTSINRSELTNIDAWLVRLPFSIYLGWISVATIANVSQVLYYFNWGGWGIAPQTWAAIMLVVAALLGLAMRWRENDIAYGLVLVWAFIGIARNTLTTAPLVVTTAWAVTAILGAAIVAVSFIKRPSANM